MQFLNFDLTDLPILDADFGVMTGDGTVLAQIGDSVTSWISRDGRTFTATPGSNFRLERWSLDPSQKVVVKYRGSMTADYSGTDRWAVPVADTGTFGRITTFSFVGSGRRASEINTHVISGIRPPNGGATCSLLLLDRVFNHFNSDSSQVFVGTRSGAGWAIRSNAPNAETGYSYGRNGQRQSFVYQVATDINGNFSAQFACNGRRFPVSATGGVAMTGQNSTIVIGDGFDNFVDGTIIESEVVEYRHVGVWNTDISDEEIEDLSRTLYEQAGVRRGSIFGDSRTSTLQMQGSFTEGNSSGVISIRRGDAGDGITNMVGIINSLEAGLNPGADYTVILIGTNDFRPGDPPSDPIQLIEDLASVIDDHWRTGFFGQQIFLFNDTPRPGSTEVIEANHFAFRKLIDERFGNDPRITVVNSWDAVSDPNDRDVWIPSMTADNTHLTQLGYFTVVTSLLLPLIQEYFGHRPGAVCTTLNATSIQHNVLECLRKQIDEGIIDVPENYQADLTPVLDAIAAIPGGGSGTDLTPVLDAIAALPDAAAFNGLATDVSLIPSRNGIPTVRELTDNSDPRKITETLSDLP